MQHLSISKQRKKIWKELFSEAIQYLWGFIPNTSEEVDSIHKSLNQQTVSDGYKLRG